METLPPSSLILAIESATPLGSVALFGDGQLIACYEYERQNLHAKLMAPLIERILSDQSWSPRDLTAVAVGRGPGSYTGLRVGVATAKGLCMALGIPLISIGSLEAIASAAAVFAVNSGAKICPMIDARRMEVYCAVYSSGLTEIEAVQARIIDANSFSDLLEAGKVIFLGPGSEKCREILGMNRNAVFLTGISATARTFGRFLEERSIASRFEDLTAFEPHYLKDYVATTPRKKL